MSWPTDIKGDVNLALVSLSLVLRMFVVFIRCLGFFCCHLVVVIFYLASSSQVIGEKDRFLCTSQVIG